MAERPRRTKRQPTDAAAAEPTMLRSLALPEVKLDYTAADDDGDAGGQTSEFVKRLHNMLEQNVYPGIIEWTQGGDAFVVKDMGAFISTVTPRQFKHSNFASFVRQLNKYDFHKIKASDADAMDEGKQAWVFRHPHFRAGGVAKLDLIKRKTPSQRKPAAAQESMHGLHDVGGGGDVHDDLELMRSDMASLRRTVGQQQHLIASLFARLGEPMPADLPSPELAKAPLPSLSLVPLSTAQTPPIVLPVPRPTTRTSIDLGTLTVPSVTQSTQQRQWELPQQNSVYGLQWGRSDGDLQAESSSAALRRQQQEQQDQQQQQQQQQPLQLQLSKGLLVPGQQQPQPQQAYTPMWATKPRVLLVDDDITSRMLSSKFLSVLGCSFDTAQDGMAALELMDRSHYDLVLMDIVMPRLDGLSATTRIRQFDARTPIISMTGNSHPADVVKYMSHGMNDILCKPFTRDGLVSILEKHLIHLRAVWDLRSIPRSPGLPPMSDAQFGDALADGVGVADDEFASLLQGFTAPAGSAPAGGSAAFGQMMPQVGGKRGWDAMDRPDSPFGNDLKRPRFELVE